MTQSNQHDYTIVMMLLTCKHFSSLSSTQEACLARNSMCGDVTSADVADAPPEEEEDEKEDVTLLVTAEVIALALISNTALLSLPLLSPSLLLLLDCGISRSTSTT